MLGISFVFVSCSDQGKLTKKTDSPGPRWGHVFVFDPVRNEVLFFGGGIERGTYLDDTWTWDGEIWKKHCVPGPSARGFSAAAFHAERGTVILHGGRGSNRTTYSDTWEWDGVAWRQVSSSGPYRSDHHRIVYDPNTKALLAFGGWNGEDVSGETWQWKDKGWTLLADSGPRKRGAFAMAFDKKRGTAVLFGGLYLDGQYADVWEWNGRQWRQIGGPYDHSSVDHHSMVYDAARSQLVVFGGKNYRYRPLQETMVFTGEKFVLVQDDGPAARHSCGLTYDSIRKRIVLYGGKYYEGEKQLAFGDTAWIWDGESWEAIK
jgi:hypothetical protein